MIRDSYDIFRNIIFHKILICMKSFITGVLLCVTISSLIAGTRYYRASWRDDPSTTIVIGWCDDGASTNAGVYFGTVDEGSNYQAYPFNRGIDRTQNYKGLNHRFARLGGLIPDMVYYFVVHDDQGTSTRMIFKTMPDNSETPVSFIAGGDSRTGIIGEFEYSLCRPRRQDANRLAAKIRPSFITFSGDYVYSMPPVISSTNAAWADWWADWQLTITPDGQLIPLIPAFGNHELSDDVYNMFDIPDNNTFYSLPIGGNLLRIYTLNTELGCDTAQQNWLSNDLQLHTGTPDEPYWKFAQYHYPFVPHANYSPNTEMIACWAPLFQAYQVKLAAESHAHIIKVTWPVVTSTAAGSDNGFTRDDANGIVYIGEGSWGAPLRDVFTYYSPDAAFNWTRNQEKMPGFQLVCVSRQKIEVRAFRLDNIASVGQVQLSDPSCTLPSGASLWNPSNGSVVTIQYNGSLPVTDPVNSPGSKHELSVYPVPSDDLVTISYEKLTGDAQIEIYNSLGLKIATVQASAGTQTKQLSFAGYPQGTYFVFVKKKTGTETCKVIHAHK